MSTKESALYSGLNRGGCSLMGEDITPTLISGISKQNGTTQDKLNVMVLNDQGGAVMNTSEDIAGALRAQEHGHQPIVFEPGAASRLGRHCYEGVCGTLRAEMGDNQPAVAYSTQACGDRNDPSQSYMEEKAYTVPSNPMSDRGQAVVYGISAYESNSMKSSNPHSGIYEAETTRTLDNNGGNPACNQGGMIVLEGNGSRPIHKGDGYAESEVSYTLNAVEQHAVYDARGNGDGATSPTITGDHENRVTDYTAVCVGNGQAAQTRISDKVGALNCMHDQQAVFSLQRSDEFTENDVTSTQSARQYKGATDLVASSVVRRLTPLECERLQGYPSGWTDIGEWVDSKGKTHKDADSPRYKALGNSIALPFWEWMAKRMVEKLKEEGVEEPTMASLFSGIGGFELVYARAGCKPVWGSEVESFCIAVTKRRFPE